MKKVLIVFMIFVSALLQAETQESSKSFSLILNKSGTNMIRFTEYEDNTTEKTRIQFAFYEKDQNYLNDLTQTSAVESFRVSWNIYSPDYAKNTSVDLYIDFESYSGDKDYMMRKVNSSSAELDRNGNGLNYNVIIGPYSSSNKYSVDGNSITIPDGQSDKSMTSLGINNRVVLFKSENLDPYVGESGYADISLKLDPPAAGYMSGQYQGLATLNLIIN